jgi:hypothetical protein
VLRPVDWRGELALLRAHVAEPLEQ